MKAFPAIRQTCPSGRKQPKVDSAPSPLAQFWNIYSRIAVVFCCLAAILTGCSTTKSEPRPIAPVSISTPIELSEQLPYRARVVMDPQGRANVFLITSHYELEHLVLDRQGILNRHIILRDACLSPFDVAIDALGTLYVLDDKILLTGTPAGWRQEQCEWVWQIVTAGTNLFGLGHLNGSKLGSPLRVEIFGFGGYGGGIIWPCFGHGSKVVLASYASTNHWTMLAAIEPETRDSVWECEAVSPNAATLWFFYPSLGPTLLQGQMKTNRLARFQLASQPAPTTNAIFPIRGFSIGETPDDTLEQRVVFPHRGWVLPGKMVEVPPEDKYWNPHYAFAGTNQVHAVACKRTSEWTWSGSPVMHYLFFSAGTWSEPVDLTAPDKVYSSLFRPSCIDLASGPDGRAVVLVPLADGRFLARWIELISPARPKPAP
jgi:hypothetical protein